MFKDYHPKYPFDLVPRGDAYGQYKNGHGEEMKVNDPYRALEKTQDPATIKWVDAELDLLSGMIGEKSGRNKGFDKKWEKANKKFDYR